MLPMGGGEASTKVVKFKMSGLVFQGQCFRTGVQEGIFSSYSENAVLNKIILDSRLTDCKDMDEQGGPYQIKTGGPWLLGSDTSNEMKCA